MVIETCLKTKYKILISIFCGMLMACLDEFHQLYSRNRGPKLSDVGIDTMGIISGVILAFLTIKVIYKIYNQYKRGKRSYDKFQRNCRRENCKSN